MSLTQFELIAIIWAWELVGTLQVGRGLKCFRAQQGSIHGNPASGNHPCEQLPLDTITLNGIQWKKLVTYTITQCFTKTMNHKRRGRAGSENPQRFAKTLATHARIASQMNDPQRSAAKRQKINEPWGKLQTNRTQMGVTTDLIGSCLTLWQHFIYFY